jgi:peptidoglycan/xylan/chitin deacetylase (PgdA/CDA1 family)
LLKKYSIPATIFLTTACIDNRTVLLSDQLAYMIGSTIEKNFKIPVLSQKTFFLKNEDERLASFCEINSLLKKMPHYIRAEITEQLRMILNISLEEIQNATPSLSWQEIKEMHDSGLVSYGTHTVSHPILTQISLEQLKHEILYPKLLLERQLGEKIEFIAYPNGTSDDYDEKVKTLVAESGYVLAFTTNESVYACDPYEIPRFSFESEPLSRFALKIAGIYDIINMIRDQNCS